MFDAQSAFADIADFALGAPDIPESALEMAATLLLDTLGVAAAAAGMAPGRLAREHALRFHAAAAPEDAAPLLFDGRSASIPGAGFAAATQIDNLDAHDGLNATKGHIGCAIVPALFAFAHRHPGLTGRQALEAMVIAYEISARAAITLHATVADYHTSGAWNALGVAALGARLRGMRAEQLRHALGIAEFHGPRSQMMREVANPTMLHDGSGMGALVGSMAALLAAEGFTGAPAVTVETEEAAPFWADLGRHWSIEQNYIKPWPICRWAHAALDALSALMRSHGFGAGDVAAIEVNTFGNSAALFSGRPLTSEQAQYSMPYPLAVLLVHGRIGPKQITAEALADPRVVAAFEKITLREEPRHTARFPAGRWSDIVVTLGDGTRLTSGDVNARGGPEAPMALEEVQAKFALMTEDLAPARAAALWDMRARLLAPDTRFSELAALALPPV